MFGYIQKIILAVITVLFSVILCLATVAMNTNDNDEFGIDDIIVLSFAMLGFLSFVFHIKTIKFHKEKNLKYLSYKKDKLLWICHWVYTGALGVFTIFLFMVLFFGNENTEVEVNGFLIASTIFLFATVWCFFDIRYLYKNYKDLEAKAAFNTIDDIKGMEKKED
jgi:branched-subunit amino acid transport protein AzlD